MIPEIEIKRLREEMRQEFAELRKMIMGRGILGNWVKQDQACLMLGIKRRHIYNIRIHLDKDQKKVGFIRWRKGKGRSAEYHKGDIEKYLNEITVA